MPDDVIIRPTRRSEPGVYRLVAPSLLAHGISFVLPLANLAFLATGPHAWDVALIWTLPVWLCIYADLKSPATRGEPPARRLAWPFTVTLYLLFTLQWVNIALMLQLVSALEWSTPYDFGRAAANIAALRILTGTTSCCSGIAVAHELIHRRPWLQRWMGRMLLWTVCYDHFCVEHLRGHHRHAGTPEDPATAHFGESYEEFWRRTWKQQFVSAWRLEAERLAAQPSRQGLWRHRVLHGILMEACIALSIVILFGPVALAMFFYQALVAMRLLEAVNYFQHWGLTRTSRYVVPADAWATDSWFTLHAFIGLARHADHHARGRKPYQDLSFRSESPNLPFGYFAMAILVRFFNARYRQLATDELRARKLGPFRPNAAAPPD